MITCIFQFDYDIYETAWDEVDLDDDDEDLYDDDDNEWAIDDKLQEEDKIKIEAVENRGEIMLEAVPVRLIRGRSKFQWYMMVPIGIYTIHLSLSSLHNISVGSNDQFSNFQSASSLEHNSLPRIPSHSARQEPISEHPPRRLQHSRGSLHFLSCHATYTVEDLDKKI